MKEMVFVKKNSEITLSLGIVLDNSIKVHVSIYVLRQLQVATVEKETQRIELLFTVTSLTNVNQDIF
jgi:hypothetical protein